MGPKKSNLSSLRAAVNQYNNSVSKCQVVLNSKKYDKYESTLAKLEDKFDELTTAWETYKIEILEKGKTEEEFNANKPEPDQEECVYPYNDAWKTDKEKSFLELFERLSDDKPPVSEDKVDTGESWDLQLLCQEIKTQLDIIENTTIKLTEDIIKIPDASAEETVVEGYKQMIDTQRERLTAGLGDKLKLRMKLPDIGMEASYSRDEINKTVSTFTVKQLNDLDLLQLSLAHKLKPRVLPSPRSRSPPTQSSAEKVLLAKSKPPVFKGDIIEYPEFKRKWGALVQPANLPAESELDKLRDAVPKLAKDQLLGCSSMAEAWGILDKRFGNTDLLAKKLKDKLKNITADGTSDPEKVQNLQIKVRTIIQQLETLQLQDCLQHDTEFLAAVYNNLPSKYQDKWLDVEKSSNKWNDMVTFLDKMYTQAIEQLVLLGTIEKGEIKKKAIAEQHAITVQHPDNKEEPNDDIEIRKKRERRKRLKEEFGPCPNCKEEHTFVRRFDKMSWPSDRLYTCKKFSEMTPKERGTLLEKLKACPRCTSWSHNKQNCPLKPTSCSVDLPNNTKCGKDHSYLVHDSGIIYCNAVKSSMQNIVNDHASVYKSNSTHSYNSSSNKTQTLANPDFSDVNIDQQTAYYMQDIPVKNTELLARTFFDDGSNRVLIRDEFAAQAGLVKKKVLWKLLVVGKEESEAEAVESYLYLAELVDKAGKCWKIWGYGIDSIMKTGFLACCI